MIGRPDSSVARRADAAIAMASIASGIDRAALRRHPRDAEALRLMRLTAWLMRDQSAMDQIAIAAWLGVTVGFVGEACFTIRRHLRRLSPRGIDGETPTPEMVAAAAELLREPASVPMVRPLPVSDCLAAVTLAFGLSHAEITSNGRALRAARARHCFCWLAGIATIAEPKEIGRRINRSRTAVTYGAGVVGRLPGAAALREDILARLDGGDVATPELIGFGRRLEDLTRPTDMERLKP